jgi:hypothetical protein
MIPFFVAVIIARSQRATARDFLWQNRMTQSDLPHNILQYLGWGRDPIL